MKKIISVIVLSALAVLLNACGGGSSSSGSTSSNISATINTLDALRGTYVMACKGDNNNGAAGESSQGTTTITTTPGSTGGAVVSMHLLNYTGSTNCSASTLDTDVTVNGQVSGKGTTKNYIDATGSTVTANVVTFTYTGMTLAVGNLAGSLPVAGVTTDVAYVLNGNNLYVSKGHRGADGLGDSLTTVSVRQ